MSTWKRSFAPARKGDTGADRVLVTAHYDSFWNGVHAMDNAAGTATVIALSRSLMESSGNPLEFIIFGGEELGFWGSMLLLQSDCRCISGVERK